ncbi:Interference hedgehog [Labeo rohita]|uniref:Interference hedgehog n=1 Tax=Labeo rohita TaxID=84645 RepID=A0ABQ8MTR4_LABRO|nr:Interference hedgehog [Labeo rohita]
MIYIILLLQYWGYCENDLRNVLHLYFVCLLKHILHFFRCTLYYNILQNDQNEENAEDGYDLVDMDDGDQDYVNVDQNDSELDRTDVSVDITIHRTSSLTSVTGELQMPTFSLTSTRSVVSHGENIQIRCTTPKPRCNANAEFQLFRNGLSVSSQKHVSSVTFSLVNVNVSNQGSYSCQYSYQNNIKSPLSNTVIITVGE